MVDRVGQQLGNYRLSRLLGKGGFAEVYLGEHIYLKTPAAIKLLQTKVGNQEDLDGFLTEAQTIAQLVHPQIVRILDFGVDGDTPFLVMDYAIGGTLRQRHPKGTRLPLPTILPYVKQVAEALQYAHEEKFIHRDVKPENMLVGRRDAVLLSDFGIALIAQSSRYQSTQEVIGTVAYMSPEQIQGKPRPASDQYSLGIVVYEWLSGDRPFHGSFTELCTQHMFASLPPLREKVPTISPAVEQVVTSALAKDPHQRFSSVLAFANALEQASQAEQATLLEPKPLAFTSPAAESPVASSPLPPTQYAGSLLPPSTQAAPPSLPPTQYAKDSPLQGARLSASDNAPTVEDPSNKQSYIQLSTHQELLTQPVIEGKSNKKRIWQLGWPQVISMFLGTFLSGGLLYLDLNFPIANLSFSLFFVDVSVVLFCGIVFGPWVGLITGGVGLGISSWIYLTKINFYKPLWILFVGIALAGFVAGLVWLQTQGIYNTRRSRVLAEVYCVLGLVIAIATFIAYISQRGIDIFNPLLYGLIGAIPVLIFLPIFLTIYARSTKRQG